MSFCLQVDDYDTINRQHHCVLLDETGDFSRRAEELTCSLSQTNWSSIFSLTIGGDDRSLYQQAPQPVGRAGEGVEVDVCVKFANTLPCPRERHNAVTGFPSLEGKRESSLQQP
ncbi:hypothetical protein STCU_09918 [Strigomonas culicis]|uniref:Uncharacterized protein n=1 Tax=Strigomonas culicis TaxID=28005 RepID=S9TJV3_9TRYP|nr:hypothetical protein STCU_09918 [Strigomonas culicis]|eukprot:EPY18432.1 hypothetical protein STCU_09918 [Strigomonas culicis]